jgi:ADP-heptose:LPS heptosyltransferase
MKLTAHNASDSDRPRICALFPGALGDFICFLPALQALARDADTDLFARSEFADLVPSGVTVSSIERPEIRELFVADVANKKSLEKFYSRYAAIYSWHGNEQHEFVRQLARASAGRTRVFPFRARNQQIHQTDYYLSCLSDSRVASRRPVIELRREAIRRCDRFWHEHALHRRPVLALSAGSGAREKNWPEEFFLAVVEWWSDAIGGTVVLLAGPVEEERGGIEQLARRCVIATGLRLSEVAALLDRCNLYLGNDSGVSHLAAATGVRTVVLFGPSDIGQWGARGKRVTFVSRRVQCSPCQVQTMKICSHRACLTALHPGEVIEILAQLPEVVTLTPPGAGITV